MLYKIFQFIRSQNQGRKSNMKLKAINTIQAILQEYLTVTH